MFSTDNECRGFSRACRVSVKVPQRSCTDGPPKGLMIDTSPWRSVKANVAKNESPDSTPCRPLLNLMARTRQPPISSAYGSFRAADLPSGEGLCMVAIASEEKGAPRHRMETDVSHPNARQAGQGS